MRETRTNGAGSAALLAGALGSFVLGLLTVAGDKSATVKAHLVFYKPTGALSGVTTVSVVCWLLAWVALHAAWRKQEVRAPRIIAVAGVLLGLALLLTFPPVIDLL